MVVKVIKPTGIYLVRAREKAKLKPVFRRSIAIKKSPQIKVLTDSIKRKNENIKYVERTCSSFGKEFIARKLMPQRNLLAIQKTELKAELINTIIGYHGLGKTQEAKDIRKLTTFCLDHLEATGNKNLSRIDANFTSILKKLNAAKITDLENNLHNIVFWLEDLKKEIINFKE